MRQGSLNAQALQSNFAAERSELSNPGRQRAKIKAQSSEKLPPLIQRSNRNQRENLDFSRTLDKPAVSIGQF